MGEVCGELCGGGGQGRTYTLFASSNVRGRRNVIFSPILWVNTRRNKADCVILRVDGGVEFEKVDEVFASTFTREQLQTCNDHHDKCVRADAAVKNITEVADFKHCPNHGIYTW